MIKGIMIISGSGICIFYKNYGCIFDNELIGNFLLANDVFSVQMIGDSLNAIQMKEKLQFIFEKDTQNNLIFVIIADTNDQIIPIQLKLKHIKYSLLLNFPELCAELQKSTSSYHKIPNKQKIELIIDPIILNCSIPGNILEFIDFFGVRNTAIIFSTLLSKRNMIFMGKDSQLVEKMVLSVPVLLPFREFLVTNKNIVVDKIGLLIPWIKEFNPSSSNNYWWIVGTEPCNQDYNTNKSITLINIEDKKIINGINPSYYENYIIKSISHINNPQIANLYLASVMKDLLNNIQKLVDFDPITEDILKSFKINPYFLPIIEKIIKFDFSKGSEVKKDYFSIKLKQILGV